MCVYIYIYIFICIYVYIDVCIYIYIYKHIHVYSKENDTLTVQCRAAQVPIFTEMAGLKRLLPTYNFFVAARRQQRH